MNDKDKVPPVDGNLRGSRFVPETPGSMRFVRRVRNSVQSLMGTWALDLGHTPRRAPGAEPPNSISPGWASQVKAQTPATRIYFTFPGQTALLANQVRSTALDYFISSKIFPPGPLEIIQIKIV